MASTSSSSDSWIPAGRHSVQIGASLNQMLQTRRNPNPPPTSKKFPRPEYYSMRYNFKPSSIDPRGNGQIKFKSPQPDQTVPVEAEHPILNEAEVARFTGSAAVAKDVVCVLVYDISTDKYTLEKLETSVTLDYVDKRPVASHKGKGKSLDEETIHDDRPRAQEDEEGEVTVTTPVRDPSPVPPKPKKTPPKAKLPAKPKQEPPKPKQEPPKPKQEPPKAKPEPKPKPDVKPKAEPKPKPAAEVKAKPAKRPAEVDIEEIDLGGKPTTKKLKPNLARPLPVKPPPPPPRAPFKLELPGSSTSYAQPLPLPPSLNPHPAPTAAALESDDEEEDEWDEVEAPGLAQATGGQEMDLDLLNDLENQLEEVGDDEDFLFNGMQEDEGEEQEHDVASESQMPMSLDQFAGGQDEDDYSSSGSDSD